MGLSNWPVEKIDFLKEYVPVLLDFEGIVFSGEVGLVKPDRAIFELLLNRYKLQDAGRVLFIDDIETNLRSAADVGFKVQKFTNVEQFAQSMIAPNSRSG